MRAKRNNHLMDMIDRYKKWSLTHINDSDSDSDASDANNGGGNVNNGQDDDDWNLTVKGIIYSPNSPSSYSLYIEWEKRRSRLYKTKCFPLRYHNIALHRTERLVIRARNGYQQQYRGSITN